VIITYRNSSPFVHQSNANRIIYQENSLRYPTQVDTSTALKELHWTPCKLETTYPEAAVIVAGDFNKANLKPRLPKCY
jgi:hypothetical protein